MTLKQVIEALVFASPKPLLTKEVIAALRAAGEDSDNTLARDFAAAREPEVLRALSELQADYAATTRAFQLVEQVNGWTLVSDPAAAAWVRQLYPEAKPTRLSGPALETLAIIAYRQPVTRADIEAVRGVAVDGVMQVLLDRGLVKIAGRAEVPGRPLLYQTTEYFLQHFGLRAVEELPNQAELRRVALPTPPVATEDHKVKKTGNSKAPAEPGPAANEAEVPADPQGANELAASPAEALEPTTSETTEIAVDPP